MKVNKDTWKTWSTAVARPADPNDNVEAATERLMKKIEPCVVRVRGVRSQFDAHNTIKMIHFESQEEENYYEGAYQRYLKQKAKLEAQEAGGDSTGFALLVEFLKFRMAAEYCRRRHLAKLMYEAVNNPLKPRAAVAALNFKNSIIGIVKILVEEFGVPRDQISLVWGGGQTQLNAKQKAKKQVQAVADKLAIAGISTEDMLAQLDLDDVEDRELIDIPEHLRLGMQSKDERQREIDRFQSGKSLYCLYTFRAGGVGLSLHHTDELVKEKVRRKPSGYAVEEDISLIPVRPRINFVAPTYSAIELVQGLGRCPRLTSLSDTEQILIFYAGTIEVSVAAVVSAKLRCLTKVVRQKESWQDMIINGKKAEEHIKNTEGQVDDPDDLTEGEEE